MIKVGLQLLATDENRKKNANVKYEIAKIGEDEEFVWLAKYIQDITPSANDETEDTGFYDGDGTLVTEVIGSKYAYEVSGYRDINDEAQNLIAGLRHEIGDARKIILKVTKLNGEIETGEATVSNIVDEGGPATEFAPFSCTISRNSKPEITAPEPPTATEPPAEG